jgi:hypothetical protein
VTRPSMARIANEDRRRSSCQLCRTAPTRPFSAPSSPRS